MKYTSKYKYVLLTAARNEEKNIEKTLLSVIKQTIRPVQWIIISDGSTDRTDDIIKHYEKENKFIKLYRVDGDLQHNFGSKVKAINFAKKQVTVKNYDYIGILDADVSFDIDYFSELLKRFDANPGLGIAGGIIYEIYKDKKISQNISLNSVAGAVQFYRHDCFYDVGDFIQLQYGGEDAAAEITARMKSWEVRTYPDLKVLHYGYVGQASGNILKAKYRRGICFFQLGYHPLFQISRCIYRLFERPIIIGSIIECIGFFVSYAKKEKRLLPDATIKFLRNEQLKRLKLK